MSLRMKSMSRNMVASLLCRGVTLVTGLVVQRYILVAFGSSYNGLTSLITQVMSYLVLLEAGLGAASTQAFYKPLSEGDWNRVSGIMNATAASYRHIGYMFTVLLIGGSLLIPLAASGEVEFFVAALLTLITGASHIFTYMLSGKYAAFLSADRKMHVRYTFTSITTILSAVFRIVALTSGCGIIIVQLINLACSLVNCLSVSVYVLIKYPQLDRKAASDFSAINKRWSVMVHQIAGLVVNHTDILILSIADSLKMVSVYSAYNMIYGQLGTVVQSTFMQAPQGDFGRLWAKDKKAFERLYAMYETLFIVLLFIIATIAILLTIPFVRLYTAGIDDVVYVDFWLPILFVIIFLMSQIRTPAILTVNAVGAFKETQRGALIEATINLSVSLILFFCTDLGMHGLLLGTVCSYLYRTVDVFVYIYKHILERNALRLFRLLAINLAIMGSLIYIFYVWKPIQAISYWHWMLWAICVGILSVLVYFSLNLLFNFHDTKLVFSGLLHKFQRNGKNK